MNVEARLFRAMFMFAFGRHRYTERLFSCLYIFLVYVPFFQSIRARFDPFDFAFASLETTDGPCFFIVS